MEISVRVIDEAHGADVKLKNEPFPLRGRLVPTYRDGEWSWDTELFPPEKTGEMRFPAEDYDYASMTAEQPFSYVFLGAYDGDACVGLAVLQHYWSRYMYLSDLKVCSACRGRGVGKALIAACRRTAAENGYRGLYTVGQDNNLNACLFYLGCGFRIGGLDTEVYTGTSQEGKADIFFYLDHT